MLVAEIHQYINNQSAINQQSFNKSAIYHFRQSVYLNQNLKVASSYELRSNRTILEKSKLEALT